MTTESEAIDELIRDSGGIPETSDKVMIHDAIVFFDDDSYEYNNYRFLSPQGGQFTLTGLVEAIMLRTYPYVMIAGLYYRLWERPEKENKWDSQPDRKLKECRPLALLAPVEQCHVALVYDKLIDTKEHRDDD